MTDPNVLAGSSLERDDFHRRDPEWLRARLLDPSSAALVLRGSEVRAVDGDRGQVLRIPPTEFDALEPDQWTFLGVDRGQALFSVLLDSDDAEHALPGAFADLRELGPLLDRDDAALVAYAIAMSNWHQRTRFCSVCGWAVCSEFGGHRRRCTNPDDGTLHFPRTDPAVIMLVTDGDRCLLGRQSVWPEGRYSALAGFVEPGESLEDAVEREVMEEVGIPVSTVRYHSSQPWPLPASLMLGFTAIAEGDEIRVDDHELEDARWFTRAELKRDADLRLPPSIAIAHRLITEWRDESAR